MERGAWWQARWVAVAAVVACALPLLYPTIPPLTDLAGHLGRYRVMLDGGEGPLAQWYRFEWRPVGNLGVDLLVAILGPITGLEAAAKTATVLIAGGAAAACLAVSRAAHGRVSPFAFLALPFVYNHVFLMGLVNYALAMAIALGGFALWLRMGEGARRGVAVGLVGAVAWVAHVFGWAVLCILVAAAELARGRPLRRVVPEALPLAAPALFLVLWRSGGGGATFGWFSLEGKAVALLTALRDRWMAWDLLSIGVVLGVLAWAWRSKRVEASRPVLWGAGGLFAAFLLLPGWLFGSAFADLRLAPYALTVLLLSLRPTAELRWLAPAALAFAGARLGGAALSLMLYSHDFDQRLAALEHVRPGARVASVVRSECETPWRAHRLDHLGGVAMARRRVFSNEQWLVPGAALMTVRHDAAGAFRADPSQLVACEEERADPEFARVLAGMPRDAFDYLWVVEGPARVAAPEGARLLWRDGRSGLWVLDEQKGPAQHDEPAPRSRYATRESYTPPLGR